MAIETVSDLTRKILGETKAKFSLARLIEQCSSRGLRDGVEAEVCQEAARASGLAFDQNRPETPWSAWAPQRRDLLVANTGGYFVATPVLDAIDTLRPVAAAVRAGISVMPNLTGNSVVPATTANVVAYWLNSETTSITPSAPTLAQIPLVPNTAGATVTVSRLLLRQSAQAEFYLRRELLRTLGVFIDHAVLNGAGTGEPLGVLNTPDIGTTTGTSLAWDDVCGMQQTVAEANADDGVVSFIGTPAVRKLLSTRERATGSGFIWDSGRIAGQPGYVTTDMANASLVCAAWPEVILALWGPGIQLAINPNDPTGFKAGTVQIRVMVSCDVAVAHVAAVNACTAIT